VGCNSNTTEHRSDKQNPLHDTIKPVITGKKHNLSSRCDSIIISQDCNFTNLSNTYSYKVHYQKKACDSNDIGGNIDIKISILKKSNGRIIENIILHPHYLYPGVYENCLRARSYITGVNMDTLAIDNDYGELVVADLNFDGKEDLAFIDNSEGNSGPTYCFYLQTENHGFEPEHFLTEHMEFFPTKINKATHQLITYGHSSANSSCKHIYQYFSATRSWKEVSRKIVDANHPDE
jgi:hypothetical protein